MHKIIIPDMPEFEFWRGHAKSALIDNIHPDQLQWLPSNDSDQDLFGDFYSLMNCNNVDAIEMVVSKDFVSLAKTVIYHQDKSTSHNVLYRLLWRLTKENKNLLRLITDTDVMAARAMEKAVRRDAYKITAFLRFREVQDNEGGEHFIAWYESEHYSLPLKLDFFMKRFRNMRWSILTPYMAAHWDKNKLTCDYGEIDRSTYPDHDKVEDYWLTYYGHIFNPARVKKQAMLNQMPKKYWKNMPETKIIDSLLKDADKRVQGMIDTQKG